MWIIFCPLVVDSWVDLESSGNSTGALHSIHNGNSEVEKLLIEAQKESRSPSRANSKESSAQGRSVNSCLFKSISVCNALFRWFNKNTIFKTNRPNFSLFFSSKTFTVNHALTNTSVLERVQLH